MIELPLKLPESIYVQLQVSARRQNQSIHELLGGLICQKLSLPTPSQEISIGNGANDSSDYQFVTEWALPNDDQFVGPLGYMTSGSKKIRRNHFSTWLPRFLIKKSHS